MRKWIIFPLFLPWVCAFVVYCNVSEIDYGCFNSIEEVIAHETDIICNLTHSDYQLVSDAYVARGESYLLCGCYEEALEDFQQAYTFNALFKNKENVLTLFRSLFGQALVYGYLNKPEMAYPIIKSLEVLVQSTLFTDCNQREFSTHVFNNNSPYLFRVNSCEDAPIIGPDQISVSDCLDFIKNTVRLSKLLIANVQRTDIRAILTLIIEQLADRAVSCCRSGGIWKGCVQMLINKYHLWNQKWQIFGIPPDPAWD